MLVQVCKEVKEYCDVSVHFDFATTDSLRTALTAGCKALHFSGHGDSESLYLESRRCDADRLMVFQLTDLLNSTAHQLAFVFVSACFSKEIGEAFVKAGVKHVVCVKANAKVRQITCS